MPKSDLDRDGAARKRRLHKHLENDPFELVRHLLERHGLPQAMPARYNGLSATDVVRDIDRIKRRVSEAFRLYHDPRLGRVSKRWVLSQCIVTPLALCFATLAEIAAGFIRDVDNPAVREKLSAVFVVGPLARLLPRAGKIQRQTMASHDHMMDWLDQNLRFTSSNADLNSSFNKTRRQRQTMSATAAKVRRGRAASAQVGKFDVTKSATEVAHLVKRHPATVRRLRRENRKKTSIPSG